jgi:hypothetical protein
MKKKNFKKDYVALLKESIQKGMIEKFERDGFIRPVAFFLHTLPVDVKLSNDFPPIPVPVVIPIDKYLGDREWKPALSYAMHKMCENPLVIAAGFVAEANCAKFKQGDELGKLVESGAVRIDELKNHDEIIMMVFSTPINEEVFIYSVDTKNKKVGERYPETNGFAGLLTNLFGWSSKN